MVLYLALKFSSTIKTAGWPSGLFLCGFKFDIPHSALIPFHRVDRNLAVWAFAA